MSPNRENVTFPPDPPLIVLTEEGLTMRDARRFLLISAVFVGFFAPAHAAQKDDSRLIVAEDTTQTKPPILPVPPVDGTTAPGTDTTTPPATPVLITSIVDEP